MQNKDQNQNKEDQLVTKRDLDDALQEQSKKTDSKIDEALQEHTRVILEAVGKKFEKVDKEIDNLKKTDEKILNVLDHMSKQIDDLVQENKAFNSLYKRQDKKLENHEERIKKLETVKNNK